MSNREDIVEIWNNCIKENIPIVPVTHMNLEKYSERTSYSKLMLNDFSKIHSVELTGNNHYVIFNRDDMENPYFLQELTGVDYNFQFYTYLGNMYNFRPFAFYQLGKMAAMIVITDLLHLHGGKHPYKFYNDVHRSVEYYSDGRFKVFESENNHEKKIHSGLFSSYGSGLRSLSHAPFGKDYVCLNTLGITYIGNHRDYSDIYHSNDSFLFVGSRGQMFQLAFTMIDRGMDRVHKHRIIAYNYYDKMKHLNSGIIPDNMKENTGQFSINVAGVEIPIIDRIGDDDFVFYKHNFDKYKDYVEKKMMA